MRSVEWGCLRLRTVCWSGLRLLLSNFPSTSFRSPLIPRKFAKYETQRRPCRLSWSDPVILCVVLVKHTIVIPRRKKEIGPESNPVGHLRLKAPSQSIRCRHAKPHFLSIRHYGVVFFFAPVVESIG